MIDHISIPVSDYPRAKAFYLQALAPLGYELVMEFGSGDHASVGLGIGGKPDFWLAPGKRLAPPVHVAFNAATRVMVDDFYRAAMAAGGRDNGEPGIRERYHPNYYGAFVRDLDGHNIEAVCPHGGVAPVNPSWPPRCGRPSMLPHAQEIKLQSGFVGRWMAG